MWKIYVSTDYNAKYLIFIFAEPLTIQNYNILLSKLKFYGIDHYALLVSY